MKDRIRYSDAFKLKVMEELRDKKWKSLEQRNVMSLIRCFSRRAYGLRRRAVFIARSVNLKGNDSVCRLSLGIGM